jgi:thioredoxin 1
MVDQIDEKMFYELIETEKKIVVDIFTVWCQPCVKMSKIFENLSKKYPEITFVKIDLDENEDLGEHKDFGTDAIPTFLFLENGKLLKKNIGGMKQKKFEETLCKLFKIENMSKRKKRKKK